MQIKKTIQNPKILPFKIRFSKAKNIIFCHNSQSYRPNILFKYLFINIYRPIYFFLNNFLQLNLKKLFKFSKSTKL